MQCQECLRPRHCLHLNAGLDWRKAFQLFPYHSPDFLYRSATIDFRYKGLPGFAFGRFYSAPGFGPDDMEIFYISRSRDVLTFRVAFLLLRMEFMHSSFSQTGSRFLVRSLLLGIVLLDILIRMSVKCSMGSSKSSE